MAKTKTEPTANETTGLKTKAADTWEYKGKTYKFDRVPRTRDQLQRVIPTAYLLAIANGKTMATPEYTPELDQKEAAQILDSLAENGDEHFITI